MEMKCCLCRDVIFFDVDDGTGCLMPLFLKKVAQKTSGGEKSPEMRTRSLKEVKLVPTRRDSDSTSFPACLGQTAVPLFAFPGGDFSHAGLPNTLTRKMLLVE